MEKILCLGSLRIPFLSGIQVERIEGPGQISLLDTSRYTAVVMDLHRNGNGQSLEKILLSIEEIQEKSSGIPIIVVARENSLEMERRIREKGIFYYLCGELDPKVWKEILNRSLVFTHIHQTQSLYSSYSL